MIKAFILGLIEFRDCITTSFYNKNRLAAYDYGRELAHIVTFRRFEQA